MAWFLISIRKARWAPSGLPDWLPRDDFPALPLADFRVSGQGRLSLWRLEDDRSNLKQVVTALATTRDHVSNLDYALFKGSVLDDLDIGLLETPGSTPFRTANKWHRDLTEVSANRLLRLTERIYRNAERHRISESQIQRSLADAVKAGAIDPRELKSDIRKKLG